MEEMQVAYSIQLRRDTSANWNSVNPILLPGEPGFETDTGKLKIGDGTNPWNALEYVSGEEGTSSNTPNTIVVRDASGNFSAGTITANLNGNYIAYQTSSGSIAGRRKVYVADPANVGSTGSGLLSPVLGDLWFW